MTVITYGKSTFVGNAKTRRHERRRKLAIERDAISNIFDAIFGCESPDASHDETRKPVSRVDRATSLGSLRDKKEQEAPQKTNRLYYSKPTREMGVTCVGRQKIKLGSKPLYEG